MTKRIALTALLAALALLVTGCPQNLPPDFNAIPSASSVQVHQGDSETVGLRIEPLHGFSGEVEISLKQSDGSDLPAGISYSPTSVTVGDQPLDFELTVTASDTAPVGVYQAKITFSSGKVEHSLGFAIEVVPPAGTLDTSFANGGVSVVNDLTQVQGEDDVAYSLTATADAVYLLVRSNDQLMVAKLDADGALDTGFGNSGATNLGPLEALATDTLDFDLDRAILVNLAGKLVATGYVVGANEDMLLARLNSDGSLDTTFGSTGVITYDAVAGGVSGNDRGYSLLQTASGYLVAGMSYADATAVEQSVVAPFTADGTIDATTVAVSGSNGYYDASYSLAVGAGGYAAAGETLPGGARNGFLTTYDASYNLTGSQELTAFAGGRVRSLVASGDGGYYLAGYNYNGSNFDLVVAKVLSSGGLDSAFGNGGLVVLDEVAGGGIAGSDRAFSVAVDGEGRVLVAGRSFVAGHGDDLIVIRLNSDGSLDGKFGTNGVFSYDGGNGDDGAFELTLDPSGRIVVTGYTTNADGDSDLLTLRLNP
ncbi:hypothetical protein [Oceanithermus sp.]